VTQDPLTGAEQYPPAHIARGQPVFPGPGSAAPVGERQHVLETDPDLNPRPAKKLLTIDWSSVKLTSEADALALWKQIAPTGDDYSEKLDEVPGDGDIATQLAFALLHEGNFACTPPPRACGAPLDVPDPAPTATPPLIASPGSPISAVTRGSPFRTGIGLGSPEGENFGDAERVGSSASCLAPALASRLGASKP